MPIYGYLCKSCGEKFDLLIGVSSEKTELKCKKCGSKDIQRTLGSFSVRSSAGKAGSSGSSCPTGTCPLG
ncbi:MAG: zinc ribbon domain-containing protein [Candidatus Omnitrophica bacterium]|nr:zinc ribbon domain-containing protein [Candidatus Omnitrophota bacterium]